MHRQRLTYTAAVINRYNLNITKLQAKVGYLQGAAQAVLKRFNGRVPTAETELKTLPGVGAALGKLLSIVNVTARCDAVGSTNSSGTNSNSGSSSGSSKRAAAGADTMNSNSHSSSSNSSSNSSSSSSSGSAQQLDDSTADEISSSGSIKATTATAAAADVVDKREDVSNDACVIADTDNIVADSIVVQPVKHEVDSDHIAASSSSSGSGECYTATQTAATQIDATQIDATQIDTTQTQCIEDD
jgi:hypothetical protein